MRPEELEESEEAIRNMRDGKELSSRGETVYPG
jgi:hypothetical protein